MRKGGGSRKGGAFERLLAKRLSLWVTGLKYDDAFWRTAGSGGRATVRRKKQLATYGHGGDIRAERKIGRWFLKQFYVEAKHDVRAGNQAHRLVFLGEGFIADTWRKARKEARAEGRSPFVVIRTRTGEILMVDDVGHRFIRSGAIDKLRIRRLLVLPRLGAHVFVLRDVLARVAFHVAKTRTERRRARLEKQAKRKSIRYGLRTVRPLDPAPRAHS